MLSVILTSIAVALSGSPIAVKTVTVETSPAYPIISIGLFTGSLFLLAIPGKGCFTRLIKSILYLGLIAISGFIAYTLISGGGFPIQGPPPPTPTPNIRDVPFLLPVHHIVVATVFSSPLTLPIAQITTSDLVTYTTIVANIMTIITSLVGLARQLDAK